MEKQSLASKARSGTCHHSLERSHHLVLAWQCRFCFRAVVHHCDCPHLWRLVRFDSICAADHKPILRQKCMWQSQRVTARHCPIGLVFAACVGQPKLHLFDTRNYAKGRADSWATHAAAWIFNLIPCRVCEENSSPSTWDHISRIQLATQWFRWLGRLGPWTAWNGVWEHLRARESQAARSCSFTGFTGFTGFTPFTWRRPTACSSAPVASTC